MEEELAQADFAEPRGIEPEATKGHGDFIGKAWDYTGKDTEERAEAQRVYRESFGVVQGLAGDKGPDLRAAWDDALHHWRAATGTSAEGLAGQR